MKRLLALALCAMLLLSGMALAEAGATDGEYTVTGPGFYGELNVTVTIEEGAIIRDSIIMKGTTVGKGTYIEKAIVAENVVIGDNCRIGIGEEKPNTWKPHIYSEGLVTIGEDSVIPPDVRVGRNTAVVGVTVPEDYPNGELPSGGAIIKPALPGEETSEGGAV